ncbi:hypothetical protein [Rhodopirellula europaea]|uniref:hypothetical protein n=1 Tax=Rhodopirellula europaea TaxID=1263866 RepID=UPI0011818E07|nr:hypothetical protein [Rhodopirellula europaea]
MQNKIATGTRTYEKRRGLDGTEGQIIGRQLKTGEVRRIDYQRRELPWEEYRLIFQAARDLLLSRGYEKNSPDLEAQNLFAEMIPDSAELRQERKTTLKQLKSRDEKTRFLAAKHLDKLARHRHQDECVVRHPDIVAALIDALDKESRRKNSSVRLQEMLIQGLGRVQSVW